MAAMVFERRVHAAGTHCSPCINSNGEHIKWCAHASFNLTEWTPNQTMSEKMNSAEWNNLLNSFILGFYDDDDDALIVCVRAPGCIDSRIAFKMPEIFFVNRLTHARRETRDGRRRPLVRPYNKAINFILIRRFAPHLMFSSSVLPLNSWCRLSNAHAKRNAFSVVTIPAKMKIPRRISVLFANANSNGFELWHRENNEIE